MSGKYEQVEVNECELTHVTKRASTNNIKSEWLL